MNEQQKKFQTKLREIYKKQDTIEPLIQGLEGDDKVPPKKMNDCFIKLNTMVAENDEKKQKSTEKISDKKQEIEIEKIFDKVVDEKTGKKSEVNKLLILGPAGMGKSTLLKYIAYKWGTRTLWKNKFDFVYRVPLKTLLDDDYKTKSNTSHPLLKRLVYSYLESLLPYSEKADFKIEDMVWLDEKNPKGKEKILLLLDGYDEVANFTDMMIPIHAELGDFKKIILTSRPNALSPEQAKKFDRRIENSGLGNEGINQYFDRYFEKHQESGRRLQEFLAKNPAIRDICNIPVNIAMLCFIWSEKSADLEKISSMSDLYGQVVHHLGVRQHARQQSALNRNQQKLEDMRQDEGTQMGELKVLQHVAYMSLIGRELEDPNGRRFGSLKIRGKAQRNKEDEVAIQSSIVFLQRNGVIDEKTTLSDVPQYGLLKAEEGSSGSSSLKAQKETSEKLQDMNFTFLHASFQEFLTAQYLVEQLRVGTKEEPARSANFIARHRNEPRLALILKFMAGILRAAYDEYKKEEIIRAINIFWDAILCNSNGALELGIDSKVNLLMHLLSQVKENEIIDPRIPNQELAVKFIDSRILENILWWVKELKESDYISPNIKEGLLEILLNNDLNWSMRKSKELSEELGLKLQREPLDSEKQEMLILEQKEESEELGSPGERGVLDSKLIQEAIDGAVSSLIIKFSSDEQERIINKLLDDIRDPKQNAFGYQIAKKKINTVIKIVQAIKLSQENNKFFIEILLETIFDENLGQTSREGITETLKASEEPTTLKETVRERLIQVQVDQNTNALRGVIELAWAAGGDDPEFIQEIVKKITPLLEREELEIRDKAAEILTELVEGCSQSVSTEILPDILEIIFPLFNNEKKKFRVSGSNAIVRLINSKVTEENKELVIKIAQKTVPLLRESIGAKYYRALDVNHALVPLLAAYDKPKVQEIAEALISKVKNPDEQEIREFGKTLELTAQQGCCNTNLKLLQIMIKRLTPCLQSKREKVKGWAVTYIKTIAQASKGGQLSNDAIRTLTPLLRDEDKDIRKEALGAILELFQTSESLDTPSFKKILNNLIKNVDTFNPSKRSASSHAITDLIKESSSIHPKWLNNGIDALLLLAQKTSKTNKREIALDTILDLAKNEIKDKALIENLINHFTSQMKKAGPDLKARLGAMVVGLKPDVPMAQETLAGLTRALKSFNDDTKLISAKNMLEMETILLGQDGIPETILKALLPLLKTKNTTFRATIIFYITEIFAINGDKDTQIMRDNIPKLVSYFQEAESSPESQKVLKVALLGVARLFEASKYTNNIDISEKFMNILIKKLRALKEKEASLTDLKDKESILKDQELLEGSVQKVIRAYTDAENLKEAISPWLTNLLKDDDIGKIVSEEMRGLLSSKDPQIIDKVRDSLNQLVKEELNPKSLGHIFKVGLDLVEVDHKTIDTFIDALQKDYLNDGVNFETKMNAFAYLIEGLKITGYRGDKFEALIKKLVEILKSEICAAPGKLVLEPHVSNNIINLLEITGKQDKDLLKKVLLFFVNNPQSEDGKEKEESCGWVLKLLNNEKDKEFFNEVLEDVIPKLGSGHGSLVQKLSVFLLPHLDIVEKYLNHSNDLMRKGFRDGLIHYLTKYLGRFEILEQLFQENQTKSITLEEINTKLFDKVSDNCYIKRTFGFSELTTEYNDMVALRSSLAKELDRAEARQGIEVFQVAFIAIAKVEPSKEDYEAEKPLPDVAWDVINLLMKYFKKEKLTWISENYEKLRSSAYNGSAVKAIFAKLYQKILEDKVITPLEEKLITLFIQQGLTTSITKKGEILFQGVKYEIEGEDIRFMLEKIARIIIGMDQDLLAKQYKTNTPIFENSYKNGGIQEAAVDKRKITSLVHPKFVLRNDFWVLTSLRPMGVGSEIVLLEQRSAFGDYVVYKLQGGGNFEELRENFSLQDVFGKYQPGLMLKGRSKILASKAGQELVRGTFSKFEAIKGSQEEGNNDLYFQQELLGEGNDERMWRAINSKQDNPIRALENQLDKLGVSEEDREPLRNYFDGFISTFGSVFSVSKTSNSGVFQIKEIEAELPDSVKLFTKLASLIPYGIGDKISEGIVNALNYVERNKFSNNNKFIAELANDTVDLSDWVSKIARDRLELPGKIQQITNIKEEDAETEVWIQKIEVIQNAIFSKIEQWKTDLVQKTGVQNMFAKDIQKGPAFRLGESEANQMIEDWFGFCHELEPAEWSRMSRGELRKRFTTQNAQQNQANQEEEINTKNSPIDLNNQTNQRDVKREVTVENELPKPNPDGGSCNDCNIF